MYSEGENLETDILKRKKTPFSIDLNLYIFNILFPQRNKCPYSIKETGLSLQIEQSQEISLVIVGEFNLAMYFHSRMNSILRLNRNRNKHICLK